MRKHIGWYIKGLGNNKEIKDKVNYERESYKVIKILENYRDKIKDTYI
jgi:tRNA-dihydrouridine synthase